MVAQKQLIITVVSNMYENGKGKHQQKRTKPRFQSGPAVEGLDLHSSFSTLDAYALENCDKDLQCMRLNALNRSLSSLTVTAEDEEYTTKRKKPRTQSGPAVANVTRYNAASFVEIKDEEKLMKPRKQCKKRKPRFQSGVAVANIGPSDICFVKEHCLPEMNDRDLLFSNKGREAKRQSWIKTE